MKLKNRIWFFSLITSLMILTITNGCKKEEAIDKKDVVITWDYPSDIISGTPLSETQLNATADVPGTFVYTPPIGTVLYGGANQNLRVDFTPTDIANYKTGNKTVTINVTQTDYDGNVYTTVVIGTQTWMVENLKVTHYRNGDPITNITTDNALWAATTSGAYCWFNNDISKKNPFGALYNWFTISDVRGIAPAGWHVPTDSDWNTLINYLGGYSVAGTKLKATYHWAVASSYGGGNNSSGFTAFPTGERDARLGGFNFYFSEGGDWWSASGYDTSTAWYRALYYSYADVARGHRNMNDGLAIRCLKN